MVDSINALSELLFVPIDTRENSILWDVHFKRMNLAKILQKDTSPKYVVIRVSDGESIRCKNRDDVIDQIDDWIVDLYNDWSPK